MHVRMDVVVHLPTKALALADKVKRYPFPTLLDEYPIRIYYGLPSEVIVVR